MLWPPDPELAEARATTRSVARTFALACRLLPRAARDDVYRLYLVFRTLDDLVDDGRPEAEAAVAAVDAWSRGRAPGSKEARMLAAIDARHPLPRDAFAAFCAGMRHDLDRVPITTDADLDAYCYRVAGTVGITMSAVLGVRGDPAAARADAAALGAAMQLTNIVRDVDEDRAAGRAYLPGDGDRRALLVRQIARADALYDQGIAGIGRLATGRPAVRAAARMYREILREIERRDYGPGRASVSTRRKLRLALAP